MLPRNVSTGDDIVICDCDACVRVTVHQLFMCVLRNMTVCEDQNTVATNTVKTFHRTEEILASPHFSSPLNH